MIGVLRVVGALFARDARIALSYRAGFAMNLLGTVGGVAGLFFLSRAVGPGVAPILEPYGGSYLGFVIVGVALTNFMALGIGTLSGRIREGLLMGTLEFMMLSPNRLPVLLLGSGLWSHAFALVSVLLYMLAGVVLGVDLGRANIPVALLGLGLAIISFNALGLVAASVVILTKQGDPVTWLISAASLLLAGVFYPTAVLPDALQILGRLLPLTHALDVLRTAVLVGEGIDAVWSSLLALGLLTAALIVIGVAACSVAARIAQRDGSLAYY